MFVLWVGDYFYFYFHVILCKRDVHACWAHMCSPHHLGPDLKHTVTPHARLISQSELKWSSGRGVTRRATHQSERGPVFGCYGEVQVLLKKPDS